VLGLPNGAGGTRLLTFIGKVGSGFSEDTRNDLLAVMRPLTTTSSPFDPAPPSAVGRTATWILPTLVGEVAFREWTAQGHLRHPVSHGLRPDKSADEVICEP
jgi:bifunctional non-homologous end joining protein LigD